MHEQNKQNCKRKFIHPTKLQWKHTKRQVWASVKTMRQSHRPEKEIFHVSYKVNAMMSWWCTSWQYTRTSRPSHNSQVHSPNADVKRKRAQKRIPEQCMTSKSFLFFRGLFIISFSFARCRGRIPSSSMFRLLRQRRFLRHLASLFYFHFLLSSRGIWLQHTQRDIRMLLT